MSIAPLSLSLEWCGCFLPSDLPVISVFLFFSSRVTVTVLPLLLGSFSRVVLRSLFFLCGHHERALSCNILPWCRRGNVWALWVSRGEGGSCEKAPRSFFSILVQRRARTCHTHRAQQGRDQRVSRRTARKNLFVLWYANRNTPSKTVHRARTLLWCGDGSFFVSSVLFLCIHTMDVSTCSQVHHHPLRPHCACNVHVACEGREHFLHYHYNKSVALPQEGWACRVCGREGGVHRDALFLLSCGFREREIPSPHYHHLQPLRHTHKGRNSLVHLFQGSTPSAAFHHYKSAQQREWHHIRHVLHRGA